METINRRLLEEEIQSELETLTEVDTGSEEYEQMINGITKLIDRSIELEKLKNEHEEKMLEFEAEKKDRLVKNILTAAGIIIPSGLTIWGTIKSLKFEVDGTVTTLIGRGFLNKLLPKK